MLIFGVVPPGKKLALLNVPGENFFIRWDDSFSGAGGARSFGGPNGVGGA